MKPHVRLKCSSAEIVSAGLRSLWLCAGERSCVNCWGRAITEPVAENEACSCKNTGRVHLGHEGIAAATE